MTKTRERSANSGWAATPGQIVAAGLIVTLGLVPGPSAQAREPSIAARATSSEARVSGPLAYLPAQPASPLVLRVAAAHLVEPRNWIELKIADRERLLVRQTVATPAALALVDTVRIPILEDHPGARAWLERHAAGLEVSVDVNGTSVLVPALATWFDGGDGDRSPAAGGWTKSTADPAACRDACFLENDFCYSTEPSCVGNRLCTFCEDQLSACLAACPAFPPPSCFVDTCQTCSRPSAGVDHDHDGLFDRLEHDLAQRFYPKILTQGFRKDLAVSYPFLALASPYRARPYVKGLCSAGPAYQCVELRYGIPYQRDYGDIFGISGHPGDSEFYAVLLRRKAGSAWTAARADASQWEVIRDFTAAHWRDQGDSSRYGAFRFHPTNCFEHRYDQSTCNAHAGQCSYRAGYCQVGTSIVGTPCEDQLNETGCRVLGCVWDGTPTCLPELPLPLSVYSFDPFGVVQLYAAEMKHGLYHTVNECDNGGWTPLPPFDPDACPNPGYDPFYDLRSYVFGKLQNIGEPNDHAAFDIVIQDWDGCGGHVVWHGSGFGQSSPFSQHFTYPFDWPVPLSDPTTAVGDPGSPPPAPPGSSCGDQTCSGIETCVSCAADCGTCGGAMGYLDLDGAEWAVRPGGQHSGLAGAPQMTWAFWLEGRGRSGALASVWQPPDPNRIWRIAADDIGRRLEIFLFNPAVGNPVFVATPHFMGNGGWHFVIIELDGTGGPANDDRLHVWIDGQPVPLTYTNSFPVPTSLGASTVAPFEIGVNGSTFDGRVGEVAILDGLLSATEKDAWFRRGFDFSHPDLVAGYRWRGSLADQTGVNDLFGTAIEGGDFGTTTAVPARP